MAYLPNMVLYYKPTCPYCQKVLAYMQEQDLAMEMKDVLQPENLDELVELTGSRQVPCLIIDGQPMHESDDIVMYLHGVVAADEIG